MYLSFRPFNDLIQKKTTARTKSRYTDSTIVNFELKEGIIKATVKGTRLYNIFVSFNQQEVTQAICSCPYDLRGYCKHIVLVLVRADTVMQNEALNIVSDSVDEANKQPPTYLLKDNNTFTIEGKKMLALTEKEVSEMSVNVSSHFWSSQLRIDTANFNANELNAIVEENYSAGFRVNVAQGEKEIRLSCSCTNETKKLCKHLKYLLLEVIREKLLQFSFDEQQRHQILREKADQLGLGEIKNIDNLFNINLILDRIHIKTKVPVLSLSEGQIKNLEKTLLPEFKLPTAASATNKEEFIVVEKNEYGLQYRLMDAPFAKNGSLKAPVNPVSIQSKMNGLRLPEQFLFYTSILQQNQYIKDDPLIDLNIIKNPFQFPFYLFEPDWRSDKVNAQKLKPIQIFATDIEATISVNQKEDFYHLSLSVSIDGKLLSSKQCQVYGRYLFSADCFYFLKNEVAFKTLKFFQEKQHEFYLSTNQFKTFKEMFLDKLEQSIQVKYSFIKKAPKALVKKEAFDEVTGHLIYLSESEDYILITPVIRYGEIEAPLLSNRNVYAENEVGVLYQIERNETAELRFKRAVQELHPEFEDNPHNTFYYLHKQKFLDEGWFVDAFESWRNNGFTILGFNQLKNNQLSPHKMKVNSGLQSGIDWFDVHLDVNFGNQKVGLKDIQKSIANQSRFVTLGDGAKGLLPQDWIDKFSRYFRSGEIKGDFVRTHKSQFSLIDEMFEQEVVSTEIKAELEAYHEKLANFHSIRNIAVPKKLKATLRDYQKEGLNWLHFLDEFGFGGCLADDMGLGKTIQIISYFLSQIEKGNKTPNLVIVPTSLLFNWEAEIKKFAPSLKYIILYGTGRDAEKIKFNKYQVVITTYGTMMNDIQILKEQNFNVIVLDESQAIKNPNSLRYKAVRLLKSRQKIVATGTPVENNTFDLFAQLSFAVPGLLGNARQFTADYSTPIDRFHNDKRAAELQQKVHPFILRRTKKQVATELPEKTEMVLYCEMDKEQRRVYDTYKKEFQKFLKGKDEDELKSSSMHILQGLTKLRQICNSPAILSDEEYYGSQSAKIEELMMQIQKLQGEHKILVFSQFVSMLDLIKKRLNDEKIKYAYLTGQTQKRQEQVDLFQEEEEVRVFLISLKAGGTGLNLTKAEYVFIVDPWWNPAVENQAIDRAYRIGQENKVIAIRLITPDSIEEKIMKLQEQKKQLVEDLIHADSGFFKKLTKEDLMKIV